MIGLRAGRLRHCVEIQRLSQAQNDFGDDIDTWTKIDEVYAAIEPIKGNEESRSARLDDRTQFKIIIRFIDNLLYTDRLIFNSRTFHIKEILNVDERDHQIELTCVEDKKLSFGILTEASGYILTEADGRILLE